MHHHSRILPLLLLLALPVLALSGCCAAKRSTPRGWCEQKQVALPYNANSLHHLELSRQYLATGRVELAREHLQQAQHSARTQAEYDFYQTEINKCERLIQAAR